MNQRNLTHTTTERGHPALVVVAGVSLVLVAVAFHAALSGSFIWDDLQNIILNDAYRGFGARNLHWMFTATYGGHYQPLTWLSLAVDARLWGVEDAFGFHLTNLLLHAITGVIVFELARLLIAGGARKGRQNKPWIGAAVGGVFFLVHPLRVESVVWATERRDLLSGLLLFLSVLLYVIRHRETQRALRRKYLIASVAAYVLSLLSKATGMTLPVILLILDAYPLGRFSNTCGLSSRRSVLTEKAWYAIPAGLAAWAAVTAQAQAGAMWTLAEHPLSLRTGQAFYGLAFYPLKTLLPTGLVPLYEQNPAATMLDTANVVAAVSVVGVTAILWGLRKRAPALLTAWAAYVVLVSPMLGLAQSGPQVVADRYSYVACLPLAILLGAGFQLAWNRVRRARAALGLSGALIAVVLVVMTQAQTNIWHDPITLWTTTLQRAPDTPSAHAALGVIYYNTEDYELSREHSLSALRALPGNRSAHVALAKASLALGDGATAEREFRTALDIANALGRTDIDSLTQLANALALQSRWDDAAAIDQSLLDKPPRPLTDAERATIETNLRVHKARARSSNW